MRPAFFSFVFCLTSVVVAGAERRLERVDLRQDEEGTWLEFQTDEPANFTSFKLDSPPRVVVDFPDMIALVNTKQTFGGGVVRGWTFERLGDEKSPVVRVFVELREDVDYTLSAEGTRVDLRFQPTRARALVSLETEERKSERRVPSPIEKTVPTNVEPPPLASKPAPLRVVSRLAEMASLERVSFRPVRDGARVVIRTSKPVAWALTEKSSTELLVELQETHIPEGRNRLPLETRFFSTPVGRVSPFEGRDGDETRIIVTLSKPARWSAFADGAEIVLEVEALYPDSTLVVGGAF